jgi:hypothetical protein
LSLNEFGGFNPLPFNAAADTQMDIPYSSDDLSAVIGNFRSFDGGSCGDFEVSSDFKSDDGMQAARACAPVHSNLRFRRFP